jgi:hypothetical protein
MTALLITPTSHECRDEDHNLRLIRVPTGFSLVTATDTNSIVSDIIGPGRVLGAILASAGQRFETAIDRFAERLPFA